MAKSERNHILDAYRLFQQYAEFPEWSIDARTLEQKLAIDIDSARDLIRRMKSMALIKPASAYAARWYVLDPATPPYVGDKRGVSPGSIAALELNRGKRGSSHEIRIPEPTGAIVAAAPARGTGAGRLISVGPSPAAAADPLMAFALRGIRRGS